MVSVDVLDKPVTSQKVWDRLLSGMVFDALEAASFQNRFHKRIRRVRQMPHRTGPDYSSAAPRFTERERARGVTAILPKTPRKSAETR
jgi:hypothetical protein